jgi:RNA polymerase I-specific transcription initiation factor RRN7
MLKLPQELVRDIWALRLHGLSARALEISDEDEGQMLFSSQPATDTETEAENESRAQKSKSKKRGKDAPGLVDTIGLCYLAALLLRLPVSLGDFHKYNRLLL